MDSLKMAEVNTVFTSLTHQDEHKSSDETVDAVSSLADIWIDLKNEERNYARTRSLRVIKSRGMGHATSSQDFAITRNGVQLLNPQQNWSEQ
jgi:circadian clock protein KaiC